jgi:peptidoglycan/LPS O-acetylase OafA/YrhL
MNFETMSKQRKMVLIAAAAGIICMFLPWWSVSTYYGKASGNGMHDWGIVVFIGFVIAGGMCLSGDQTTNFSRTNWMIVLIAGGIALLIILINLLNNLNQLGTLSFGFYGAWSAAIGVVLYTYNNRNAEETLQNGFDSLKSSFGARTNTTPNQTSTNSNSSSTNVVKPTDDNKPAV